jgi:branched-chain amino acid transport system permease protein
MMTKVRYFSPAVVGVVLVFLPMLFGRAGTLQILATGLIFASLALTYNLLLGFTGLLSFGHALFFGTSVYATGIALTRWGWSLTSAALLAIIFTTVLGVITGAIALRVGGVPFAMVTLALAQGGFVLAGKNPGGVTNGADGFGLAVDRLPDFFVGVVNTKNLYWLSLALLVITYFVVSLATTSSPGRVWQGLRDNELRVEVLGLRPYTFKLISFTLAAFLSSLAGIVFTMVQGSITQHVLSTEVTLTLLVMVVLGGVGSHWGAALGGFVYTVANEQLTRLANSSAFEDLPTIIRGPLTQPVFLLGSLFVLVVLFAPGGLAGAVKQWELKRR